VEVVRYVAGADLGWDMMEEDSLWSLLEIAPAAETNLSRRLDRFENIAYMDAFMLLCYGQ